MTSRSSLFASLVVLSLLGIVDADSPKPVQQSLVADEPVRFVGKPDGAADYVAKAEPTAGQHLALTLHKLENGFDPDRPFLIWAIGSSYTDMLGSGEPWFDQIPKRFPNAPKIRYQKMVGNACPWQYLRGWARHLVIVDQPDLVITYTNGDAKDLEKLIIELRSQTTADIIVPSLHWRERDHELWGNSENATDQDVAAVREVCFRHNVEFVENRRDWASYLTDNNLPIFALLRDHVHQSRYGSQIINANILAHIQKPLQFSYAPENRERRIDPIRRDDGSFQADFSGNRIDLIGKLSPNGGVLRVLVDGKPAEQTEAFITSYIQPDENNSTEGKAGNTRDTSPHGITLGTGVVPQDWTIVMTSDHGDYRLIGSKTGVDGNGNAFKPFASKSGQIIIEPDLWRRAERNRTGDRYTFTVRRSVLGEVSFQGEAGERFTVRVAQLLSNSQHTLELIPVGDGETVVEAFDVFEPPMK